MESGSKTDFIKQVDSIMRRGMPNTVFTEGEEVAYRTYDKFGKSVDRLNGSYSQVSEIYFIISNEKYFEGCNMSAVVIFIDGSHAFFNGNIVAGVEGVNMIKNQQLNLF